MKILIAGLPGSGKTTQAHKLSEELGLCLIKTGEILREMASKNNDLAQELNEKLLSGSLVDNELISQMLKSKVEDENCKNGYVIDGYPRSADQINFFDPEYDVVFFLEISEKVALDRLTKRGRSDDTPEAIKKRLQIQDENMLGVLGYYLEKGVEVHTINGEKSEDQVHADIRSYLPVGD